MPASTSRALETALRRMGDRWSLLVIDALLGGPQRFSELADAVPGIATNVLSQRLKQLEAASMVVGTPYTERPLRYQYALTEAGRGLADPLRLLAHWGSSGDDAGASEPIEHTTCGTALEVRWFCPTCARVVDGDDEVWEV